MYPRLNQGEWVSPLVNAQHFLDSVRSGKAPDLRKINITYGFLNAKQNEIFLCLLENKVAYLPRFIVLEYLEETYLAKLLPFLIEKVILRRDTRTTVKKTRNGNLLVKVNNWRHAENIPKVETFHKTKCKA